MRETIVMKGATAQAIPSALRNANCLGTNSPIMTEK